MLTINQLQRLTAIHDNFEILGQLEDLVMYISRYPETLDILENLIGAKILRVQAIPVDDYDDIKLLIISDKPIDVFNFIKLTLGNENQNIEYKFIEVKND